jgi:3-hydroxyisobutyrate dehydrogenase-like beta-hydroxyacid dehydrogenase
LICKRAAEAQVELVASQQELTERSEMVVSAVSADMAVPLAQASRPFLKANQIYVDMNATSPMTKQEVDKIISPVALFVDCAVMGPVPTYRHKVPVAVSGKGAKRFHEARAPSSPPTRN